MSENLGLQPEVPGIAADGWHQSEHGWQEWAGVWGPRLWPCSVAMFRDRTCRRSDNGSAIAVLAAAGGTEETEPPNSSLAAGCGSSTIPTRQSAIGHIVVAALLFLHVDHRRTT